MKNEGWGEWGEWGGWGEWVKMKIFQLWSYYFDNFLVWESIICRYERKNCRYEI